MCLVVIFYLFMSVKFNTLFMYTCVDVVCVCVDEKVSEMGALEEVKESIRTEPFSLPADFMWDNICLEDSSQVMAC